MAGISAGRYNDFLLQEIMVFGLERRWSAVDTWRWGEKKKKKVNLRENICTSSAVYYTPTFPYFFTFQP